MSRGGFEPPAQGAEVTCRTKGKCLREGKHSSPSAFEDIKEQKNNFFLNQRISID